MKLYIILIFACIQSSRCDTLETSSQIPSTPLNASQELSAMCESGFDLTERGECVDIDECARAIASGQEPICETGFQCMNTRGSYQCISIETRIATFSNDDAIGDNEVELTECADGYEYNKKLDSCVDINECENGSFLCFDNEYCINQDGSYSCEVIKCPDGQRPNARGACYEVPCAHGYIWDNFYEDCVDINECQTADNNQCNDDEVCKNTIGSFVCATLPNCTTGYKPSQYIDHCIDIDECAELQQSCSNPIEHCVNTIGSFSCDCNVGYTRDLNGTCMDIDECLIGSHHCSELTSSCENIVGGYHCVCKHGFQHDNLTNICKDVDECESGSFACFQGQQCVNLHGSYTCRSVLCREFERLTVDGICEQVPCDDGYKFDQLWERCLDIDECQSSPCQTNETCYNLEGSFKCVHINCTDGDYLAVFKSKLT